MKFVYVLIASEENFYYEQLIVSVKSIKLVMDRCHIILLTDSNTNDYLHRYGFELKKIIDELKVVEFPEEYSHLVRSRLLKTMMRSLVSGDFIFLDCDTIVCEPIYEINEVGRTAAVLDNHSKANEKIAEFAGPFNRAKKMGYSVGYEDLHFNSGVIWCKDDRDTYKFFDLWHKLYQDSMKQKIYIDQLAFNEANNRMGGFLYELNGKWNCQLRYGLPFLAEAKVIHYLASGSNGDKLLYGYYFSSASLYRSIRNNKALSDKDMDALMHPRSAFNISMIIDVFSDNYEIATSQYSALLRHFYRRHKNAFVFINRVLKSLRKQS